MKIYIENLLTKNNDTYLYEVYVTKIQCSTEGGGAQPAVADTSVEPVATSHPHPPPHQPPSNGKIQHTLFGPSSPLPV